MNHEKWEEFYRAATMEVDGKKMPGRIAAVRDAIRGRLQDLERSSDHHAERERMTTILERLKIMESESQKW